MQDYLSMSLAKRKRITTKIKQSLLHKREVVFAYIFGSFLDAPSFRDIDVAVYLKNVKKDKVFDLEFALADGVSKANGLPAGIIEVHVLNFTPLIFQNTVFRTGKLLFTLDKKLLTDLIEKSSLEAIANEYIRYQSLKELVPA